MDEAKETWDIDLRKPRETGVWTPFAQLNGREYLQYFGTKARETFGDEFWVNQLLPKPSLRSMAESEWRMRQRFPGWEYVTITDMRFENEARRVRHLGGFVIEVTRPGVESDGHDSEQKILDELVDYRISNDGSLQDLTVKTRETLSDIERAYEQRTS